MESLVFGTAGHVDHGKTTLVQALTGQDTDRLPEEKSRGISIELGFAHKILPSGRMASFVDVPGHERFVRNMVAGVHGMDAAILVVAADEGVMPQTVEHLHILQLLGVSSGLTVLTKADTVDEEWLQLVRETTAEALRQSFLKTAPLVIVDAVSGRGMGSLEQLLDDMAGSLRSRNMEGYGRLPIDRVFSVRGFGTVVTGTLVAGSFTLEQAVELQPGALRGRIRGLEVHGQPCDKTVAGQRVAVNLSGVAREAVKRGQVLSALGARPASDVLVVALETVSNSPVLGMNAEVHCHLGTAEARARIYLYDRTEVPAGDHVYAELRLDHPLAAQRGDRFLIRGSTPLTTLGGGVVIEVGVRHRRRERGIVERLERLLKADTSDWLASLLSDSPRPLGLDEWSTIAGLPKELLTRKLRPGKWVSDQQGQWWFSREGLDRIQAQVRDRLSQYHQQFPLRPGMGREELRQKVAEDWPAKAFFWVLSLVDHVIVQDDWVSLEAFQVVLDAQLEEAATRIYHQIDQARLKPQGGAWLLQHWIGPPEALPEVLLWLARAGKILTLEEGVFISDQTYAWARAQVLQSLAQGIRTAAELKGPLDSNRRYTVRFLELLDAMQVTRRVGDERVPGPLA